MSFVTCPFCQTRFAAPTPARCPECGCEVVRLTSGLIKTSAVLIDSEDTRTVYRSVQEVPEKLRRRLVESTQGINSATIVIADHGGREHMEKQLDKRLRAFSAAPADASLRSHAAIAGPAPAGPEDVPQAPPGKFRVGSLARLIGIGLAAATLAGAAAWMLHGVQW